MIKGFISKVALMSLKTKLVYCAVAAIVVTGGATATKIIITNVNAPDNTQLSASKEPGKSEQIIDAIETKTTKDPGEILQTEVIKESEKSEETEQIKETEENEKPVSTEKPALSTEPVPTEKPVQSTEPVPTEKPVQPTETVKVVKPVPTDAPVKTENPVPTQSPTTTSKPVETTQAVSKYYVTPPTNSGFNDNLRNKIGIFYGYFDSNKVSSSQENFAKVYEDLNTMLKKAAAGTISESAAKAYFIDYDYSSEDHLYNERTIDKVTKFKVIQTTSNDAEEIFNMIRTYFGSYAYRNAYVYYNANTKMNTISVASTAFEQY